MEFILHYRGRLESSGSPLDKQLIRRHFHAQLQVLWGQLPLSEFRESRNVFNPDNEYSAAQAVGEFLFVPLVNDKHNLYAELHIMLLRPEPPGSIIAQSGDIDNRLKTLFDALRMPKSSAEIPKDDTPKEEESPFFCLLEDDSLINKVTVETDRLLYSNLNSSEVEMLIKVKTKATRNTWVNDVFV